MQYQSVYDLIRRALPGKESCFLLREMKVEEAATGQIVTASVARGRRLFSPATVSSAFVWHFTLSAGGVRRQSILVR